MVFEGNPCSRVHARCRYWRESDTDAGAPTFSMLNGAAVVAESAPSIVIARESACFMGSVTGGEDAPQGCSRQLQMRRGSPAEGGRNEHSDAFARSYPLLQVN